MRSGRTASTPEGEKGVFKPISTRACQQLFPSRVEHQGDITLRQRQMPCRLAAQLSQATPQCAVLAAPPEGPRPTTIPPPFAPVAADKGYDSKKVIQQAQAQGMQVQIPPRKNSKEQREYDTYLYRLRHLVENAFQRIKQWRGIAMRYAQKVSSFASAVNIRCIFMWLKIS